MMDLEECMTVSPTASASELREYARSPQTFLEISQLLSEYGEVTSHYRNTEEDVLQMLDILKRRLS